MTAPKQFPNRWRLSRAGIVNVWHYLENTFDLSGGRMILRGTNGSGKSRALEMLLPFLLDGDRRRMDATGSAKVNLDELMRVGAGDATTRHGYLWLELAGDDAFLTIGALLRHGRSARSTQVWYFLTSRRVGHDLVLLDEQRELLSRDALGELVGSDSITDSAETHRERVRTAVFGLRGDSGRERYHGLLQLLHTLRSPDVGNRIDEGNLPKILRDSLPPLGEQTLNRAGEQLDDLATLRASQQRLEKSLADVDELLGVYRRYSAAMIVETAAETLSRVDELTRAELDSSEHAARVETLRAETGAARIAVEEREAQERELQNAIGAIRSRDIFKRADDLHQRDERVRTLAGGVDVAFEVAARARSDHSFAVDQTNSRVVELRESVEAGAAALMLVRETMHAAGLPNADLPDRIGISERRDPPEYAVLRAAREGEPLSIPRPVVEQAESVPDDLDAARAQALAAVEAVTRRRDLADRRLVEARRLAADESKIARLDTETASAERQASIDAAAATSAETTRDDTAVTLASAWRSWISNAPELGGIEWNAVPAVSALLLDLEALVGDAVVDLAVLDSTAERQVRPLREAIVTERGELDRELVEDDAQRRALDLEADALRRAEDPDPDDPPWLSPARSGVPLWRVVDFADHTSEHERAGLEAALLASGLLTARIEADGALRAEDGTTLLSPGAVATHPVTQVLRPDPADHLDADLVSRVLHGIGLADDSATSITVDGEWRHGSLRGRHRVSAARHIGVAARARARDQRLAAIAVELAELDRRVVTREARLAALTERSTRLDSLVDDAPASVELVAARRVATHNAERADHTVAEARAARERASAARAQWVRDTATHRQLCEPHGLPLSVDALVEAVAAARTAADRGRSLHDRLGAIIGIRRRLSSDLSRTRTAEERRDEAESRADAQWREWFDFAADVAAAHDAIDLSVEQARIELTRSERAHADAMSSAKAAREVLGQTTAASAAAAIEARYAAELADQRRNAMIAAAVRFNHRITLPGLVRAVTDVSLPPIERPELADSVCGAAQVVANAVKRPSQPASESALLSAFQRFDREVSGQLDPTYRTDDGVAVISVAGAGGDESLAGAAAGLRGRVESGQAALSEREREVFTTFVLGGVAEELRRRINQASGLVAAMNESLRSITTRNGIGVRLRWQLADDSASLARIAELVRTVDAARTQQQNAELTELLRQRVDESYTSDPTAGYASHLAEALDYRRWHAVEATILGPDPGQERRLTSRAKLSQGETRFVSYVTLFAAADGYLSGLSDSGRQLRLILLDDAFAKVDDPTVADLMGLLVRLDLDFVMTGHALWGCFAEVPRLDVYTVRREEGTSAVTTHVHWDGRNRHLRSTA